MTPDLDILSDANRRLVLALLAIEDDLCVCELEAALNQIQPVVSRQLAILRDGGWVTGHREGRRMFYRIAPLPTWASLVVRAYTEGGVPKPDVNAALKRLARFDRPVRLAGAVS